MKDERELILIPKIEDYIKYVLNIIIKLPRTEKFSIGTEYKNNIYKMLEEILYINKSKIDERNTILNRIDSKLNYQRILLRRMKENRWIDEKKFLVCIEKIHEIGKIVGGLIRYYGKNNKK